MRGDADVLHAAFQQDSRAAYGQIFKSSVSGDVGQQLMDDTQGPTADTLMADLTIAARYLSKNRGNYGMAAREGKRCFLPCQHSD
jgi:hypothetical protein